MMCIYIYNIDMPVPKISENHMGQRFSLQLQRRASDGPQLGWSPLHRCVARLGHGCPADTSGDLMVSGAKQNMRNIGRRNPNPWPNSGRGGFRVQSELCFFPLLNCNTQIRTPTRGLRKPLLPSKTAYARVTFQEVPTRLPPRKLLQRSLYLTWCDHNSGSEEE